MHYLSMSTDYAHVCVRTQTIGLYSGGQHVAIHKAMPLCRRHLITTRVRVLRQRLIRHQRRHLSAVHALVQGWRGAGVGAGARAVSNANSAISQDTSAASDAAVLGYRAGYERSVRSLSRTRSHCFSLCLRLCCIIVPYTVRHPSRGSRCASHASSRYRLMMKMQRQPQLKS